MRIFVALFLCVMGWLCAPPVHAADSCEAGYFLNDNGEYEICPPGYFCRCLDGGEKEVCDYTVDDLVTVTMANTTGVDDLRECITHVTVPPGYQAVCSSNDPYYVAYCYASKCPAGSYCPGGTYDIDDYVGSSSGRGQWSYRYGYSYSCDLNTYSDEGATTCTECPVQYTINPCSVEPVVPNDVCIDLSGLFGYAGIESCYSHTVTRVVLLGDCDAVRSGEYAGQVVVAQAVDYNGNVGDFGVEYINCENGESADPSQYATIDELRAALYAGEVCGVPICTEDLASGCVDGEFYAGDFGIPMCYPCADFHPALIHSDGLRNMPMDCYGNIEPGYFLVMNNEDGTLGEQPCPAGDYCTGDIRITYDLFMGASDRVGNVSCADVSADHVLSDAGATGADMCYAECDGGERAYYPNLCVVECGSGYVEYDGACYQMCAAGIGHIHVGGDVLIPLFAERLTTPALNVMYNGTVCYANAASGAAAGTINIRLSDGAIYHLVK